MEGKRSLSPFRIGLILLRSYRNGVDRRVFRDSFEEPSMLDQKQKPKTIDFRIGIFDLQSNGLILFHFSLKLRSIISIEIFFRYISLSPRICPELDKLYTKSSLNHLLISPIEIEKISTWLIQKNEIGDIKKKSGRKLYLPYRDKVKRLWGSGKFPAFSST